MTIRDSLSRHFGTPMQAMGFPQYLSYLNSAGKITQRSLLELLIILCEQVEAEEKRKEQYEKNFKDIEDILVNLLKTEANIVNIVESSLPEPLETPQVQEVTQDTTLEEEPAKTQPSEPPKESKKAKK